MTTAPAIELRTFTTLDTARGDLLDVYADVRAPLLHLPNYAVTAFGERLDRHGTEPGFTAGLAYPDGHPVGNTIEHGDRYWQRTSSTPAERYAERPAVALKEIGVRPTWRKTLIWRAQPHGWPPHLSAARGLIWAVRVARAASGLGTVQVGSGAGVASRAVLRKGVFVGS